MLHTVTEFLLVKKKTFTQYPTYLFGVYGHLVHGINHHHVRSCVGVNEIGAKSLSQGVQGARLVQESQRGQILCSVKLWWISLTNGKYETYKSTILKQGI